MSKKCFMLVFTLLSLSIIFAANAFADDVAGLWGIGGTAGMAIPAKGNIVDREHDPGLDLGGWLRYGLTSNWGLMLSYDNIKFDKDEDVRTADPIRTEPILLSAVYSFLPENHLTPIFLVGAGKASVQNVKAKAYDSFAAQAGLGLEYFFTPGFAAGLLVRENWAFVKPADNGDYSNSVTATNVGLMLTYYFGASKPAPVVQVPAPAPAPAPIVEAPAPAPVVQEVSKPADTDGDGVPDSKDKEPNTPQGNLVDKDGVTLSEIVSIAMNIVFDTNKSDVKPEFDDQIKAVADFMKMYSSITAEIEGHTDSKGSDALNNALSQKRADSVRDYLVNNFGIDGARLTTKGYGSANPIADNETSEGRQENRRVVATITATKQLKK